MFESLGFENYTAPQIVVYLALALGLAFGAFAERSKFCFRRSLIGEDKRQALGVWLSALLVAMLGTQLAVHRGLINFDAHRFMTSDIAILSLVIGGALFGAGMVLTRGCASRLTVLGSTGNLRALTVLVVFALVAHATLKGVLSVIPASLGDVTIMLGDNISLAHSIPLPILLAIFIVATGWGILRSGNKLRTLALGAGIGALVPLGWVGTGFVLYDDFDPIAMESLSFTAPMTDTLFWGIASTSISAGFGTGLIGGTVLGALLSSIVFKSFAWQSFESPRQTGRYILGASLMGVGAVLAGGCTIGAGLSGIPTLSIAPMIALGSIALGAKFTHHLVDANASLSEYDESSAIQFQQPAE